MKRYIGLDLGSSSVKAVSFIMKANKLVLNNAYVLPAPENSIVDGTVIEFSEISQQVGKIIEGGNFSPSPLAVAVKGSVTAAKRVRIPYISQEQLKNEFFFIADQYIKTDPENFVLDYRIVHSDSKKMADIVLATMRKENISDYVSIMESAQQTVGTIDMEALALSDLYSRMNLPGTGESMIIHVGHAVTEMIFISNGVFSYHEFSLVGGERCTNMLIENARISSEWAENAKITPDDYPADAEHIKAFITNNFLPEFLTAVESVIGHYNHLGGQKPERVYLSGGGATLFGLQNALGEKLELPIEVMSPKSIMNIESNLANQILETKPAVLNVAIAMALR